MGVTQWVTPIFVLVNLCIMSQSSPVSMWDSSIR